MKAKVALKKRSGNNLQANCVLTKTELGFSRYRNAVCNSCRSSIHKCERNKNKLEKKKTTNLNFIQVMSHTRIALTVYHPTM